MLEHAILNVSNLFVINVDIKCASAFKLLYNQLLTFATDSKAPLVEVTLL